jgi:histone H4
MKMYISNILRDSMIYASYAGRTTLLADDICRSAKRAGQTAIGFTTSM